MQLEFQMDHSTFQTITIKHKSSQQISLDATRVASLSRFDPADSAPAIGETAYRERLKLDRSLFKFWSYALPD